MDQDELIDNLAFGVKEINVSRCLGLFIGLDKVYLSQSHLDKGRLVLDQLFKIALPKPAAASTAAKEPSSMPGAELLGDINAIADVIRPALGKLLNPPQEVVVTLSPQLALLRYFQMPGINKKFWKTAIPLEAKKHIPYSFHGLVNDFQVFPSASPSEGHAVQGVLLGVAAKSTAQSVQGLMKGLKLKLAAFEIGESSYLRFLLAMDKDVREKLCVWVHLDASHAQLLGFNEGMPLIFRETDLRGVDGAWDFRRLNLAGSIDFMSHKLGLGAVQKFFISGTGAGGPMVQALSKEAGIQAELRNPGLPLGLKIGEWEAYAAIGGSFKYTAPSPVVLDLASSTRVTDGERRAARFIFSAAALISAIFIFLGLWAGVQIFLKSQELAGINVNPQIKALFKGGKTPAQIKDVIAKIEKKSALIGGARGKRAVEMGLIEDIADNIPNDIWITRFDFENPLTFDHGAAGGGVQITLTGRAAADSQDMEQESARSFKEALSQAPTFDKLFHGNVSISIEAKNQFLGFGAQGKGQEGKTGFTISASAK